MATSSSGRPSSAASRVDDAAREGRVLVVDGGLATELERRGVDIGGPLWSARALAENPGAIVEFHLDSLRAGAEVIITASYQASLPGLTEAGLDAGEAERSILRSVELAVAARERLLAEDERRRERPPLVAASIGPYGAYLHDGSEYRGDYGLAVDDLQSFHAERFALLAGSNADLLACETIPSAPEAEALVRLLDRHPRLPAWFSFSCPDGRSVADGSPLEDLAARLDAVPGVLAVGVNCVAPAHVASLLARLRAATARPLLAYPNSGENWDAGARAWVGESDAASFVEQAVLWRASGATLIGGCCRVGPGTIREVARRLL